MLGLTDSHTHITDSAFDNNREEIIKKARDVGVSRFLSVGAGDDLNSAKAAIKLSEQYDFIWASAGVHPHDAKSEPDVSELKELLSASKVLAVGETGLDFFRDWAPKDLQIKWFRAQIELAHEFKKPIIIHSREAGNECLEILQEMEAQKVGGVFHCYSENAEFAKELAKINFLVSFPGTITFKNAQSVKEAAKSIPLEQIMLETDAPYIAPTPHRGKVCEPSFIIETAKALADLKGISLEEVAKVTSANAEKLFKFA